MMTTFTKLASYDKAIAEMQNSNRIHSNKRLGDSSPSLRSSNNGIYAHDHHNSGNHSDNDSNGDASSPGNGNGNGNGSYGSIGIAGGSNRHSFISISEENNSPSSLGASYAFMSARGSKVLQEDELARISDVSLTGSSEFIESSSSQFTGFDRGIRSPASGGKDKRAEYFAQIKSQMMQGGGFPTSSSPTNTPTTFPSTPPPPPPSLSSSVSDGEDIPKRSRRFSLMAKDKLDLEGESERKDKDYGDKFDKKKEKEKLKEEKLKKKLEKKEAKMRLRVSSEREFATPSPENPRIMQQLLGAMRPRASLSHRGAAEIEEQLKRPIDSSPKGEPTPLRRSASFKDLDPAESRIDRLDARPKFERILGTPPMDLFGGASGGGGGNGSGSTSPVLEDKFNWRKTKIVKNVTSDPYPLAAMSQQLPSPPPPPVSETDEEQHSIGKQRRPANKVLQLLGENPSIDINNLESTATPAQDIDVDEEGIVFSETREQSGHKQVKGATLKKLVDRLTCESISDTTFLLQFIITYRSFTNPHQLLELLKERYDSAIEISRDATDAERETLTKKQLIVRLRVYNVIRQWIDKQWMDFLEDPTLVDKMLVYAPTINEVVTVKSSIIEKLIEKKQAEGEKQKILMFNKIPPTPFIPTVSADKLQLSDMNSEEIARQMTLMEYSLFKAIKPWEYLCWNTKMKQTKSANILAMINKFNVMSKWVQREVLHSGDQPRQRATAIGKFLDICEHLRALKNFNGIMEILSGLNASAVHRLRLTWGCLASKQTEVFQDFNTFTTGNNYKNLRNALHTLQPPCIPYLGMYLTDLTFINDGIPLYLPDSCLINFDKCRKVSASVLEIMQYQQTPFCLSPVEDIQSFLTQVEKYNTMTEDEFYKHSLTLEERK